eukprot:COSAG01_NODE_8280_length_2846_cov_2.831452_5_plen_45_part_00
MQAREAEKTQREGLAAWQVGGGLPASLPGELLQARRRVVWSLLG